MAVATVMDQARVQDFIRGVGGLLVYILQILLSLYFDSDYDESINGKYKSMYTTILVYYYIMLY